MGTVVTSNGKGHVVVVDRARNVATVRASTAVVHVAAPGPQGPQGPPGASGTGYTHPQLTPAATWVIAHNMGVRPAVDLYDLGGREFDAEIVHLSENVLEVRCLTPTAGYARLT